MKDCDYIMCLYIYMIKKYKHLLSINFYFDDFIDYITLRMDVIISS